MNTNFDLEDQLALLAEFGAEAKRGLPTSKGAIRGAEARLGVVFPPDYRAFLETHGRLDVSGMSVFRVLGVDELASFREDWRTEFGRWADPGFRDVKPPAGPGPLLLATRSALRDRLRLNAEDVEGVVGDSFDALRIAYAKLVPVLVDPDDAHHVAVCVGPNGRLYSVSIKSYEVDALETTFLDELHAYIDMELRGGAM